MRPLILKMTAFGPYKSTEIVDFTELGDQRLFVVSGSTGSGKTTIFDGICFALYGQASGEDRTDIRAMRSDFADDSTQTTVELTFEIHSRLYRIMRQIPYIKKGNKSETAGRCELYEQTSEGEIPIVDRQMVSEINKKIEDLIGFTQAQFSQIVMLPQGEFRKFLTSDTENKEVIMRKIFKTEPYREVVTRLKDRKDAAETAYLSEKQLSESYVQQISTRLPERESTIFSVLSSDYYNIPQIILGLEEELLFYQIKKIQDKKKSEEAYSKHERKLAEYHIVKSMNLRFEELELKGKLLKELSEQLPRMEVEGKRLANAERASFIEEIEKQYVLLKKEVLDKENQYKEAVKEYKIAVAKKEEANTLYEIEENRKAEREQLSEKLIRLTDHLPTVSALESKKEMLQKMEKEVAINRKKQSEVDRLTEEAIDATAELQKQVDSLEKIVEPLEEKNDEVVLVKEKCRLVDEFLDIQKQVKHFDEEKNKRFIEYESEKGIYRKSEKIWLDNQVFTIAATLHDGEACPVCGSTDHPAKSLVHLEAVVTKEDLERANQTLASVESMYRTQVANYESSVALLERKTKEVKKYSIEVEKIQEEADSLHAKRTILEEEILNLRKKRADLVKSKERLKKQSDITENLARVKGETEKTVLESSSLLISEQSILDASLLVIPEDVRELNVLENRIGDLKRQKVAWDRAWEVAQKSREETREVETKAEANMVHAGQSVEELKSKRASSEERFKQALQKSEFETEEAYSDAKMEEEERRILEVKLKNFNQQLHTVSQAVSELQEMLVGKEKVELAGLEIAISELKNEYETALKAFNTSTGYVQITSDLITDINKTTKKLIELERKHGKITELYDLVRGQNSLKLSFERYIQIEYLEQIIHSANERLKDLSNGQFTLIRSERHEARGRQSGLGLDVNDAYTGQMRDVKTLSGGEKFNASLCLALGMADVIQSFQGSVSIDTMFIDEGFGSLDEESLNKAIDTLINLQKSGRMIGVISHVEELKAAFPAILEVIKSREGHSRTSFLIK
ncbi:AAA family ATPase [Sporosarcina sp. CAU 1771]